MKAGHSIKTLESVLDLAVWLEKHGHEFYAAAMVATDDPELEELFSYLMQEEQKHFELYSQLYTEQTGQPATEEPLLGEYAHFIDLLVREITSVLLIDDEVTPERLIWKALRFEKDTLLYFNEIRRLFPDDRASVIDQICREERKHIRRLMEKGKEMQLFLHT